MKLLIIVNEDRFFLSHRKDIAVAAQKKGWNVTIICKDTGQKRIVESFGLRMLNLPINPTGTNIIQDLRTCLFLYRLYRQNKDAIVHHVGLKNILWGGLAAKFAGVKGVVNAVSGLGTLFNGKQPTLTAKMVMKVMRFSNHRKNVITIFQNHEDEALFIQYHVVSPQNNVFIKGSGVDLREYDFTSVL